MARAGRLSVALLGATGAVGGEALKTLLRMPEVSRVTSLGRRKIEGLSHPKLEQKAVDVFDPAGYEAFLPKHEAAVCTFGIGQPTKVSRTEFERVDRDAVLAFGAACLKAGVRHFSLLGAVGADAGSVSHYLKVKGQLEEGLALLGFERLSLFRPSMILTPQNRYGLSQGVLLKAWPLLDPLLAGPLRRFRGIRVSDLGAAMALNLAAPGAGVERLEWDQIRRLAAG